MGGFVGGRMGENTTTIAWLPEVIDDLVRLRDFIRVKNPAAVKKAAERITSAILILQNNPEVGRPLFEDMAGFRDLIVPFGQGGYVIRYRMHATTCVIIRIWHTKEDFP